MAVAADGRFLYISETVSIYLGLSQVSVARRGEMSMKPMERAGMRVRGERRDEKSDNDNEKAKANKKQRGRADARMQLVSSAGRPEIV